MGASESTIKSKSTAKAKGKAQPKSRTSGTATTSVPTDSVSISSSIPPAKEPPSTALTTGLSNAAPSTPASSIGAPTWNEFVEKFSLLEDYITHTCEDLENLVDNTSANISAMSNVIDEFCAFNTYHNVNNVRKYVKDQSDYLSCFSKYVHADHLREPSVEAYMAPYNLSLNQPVTNDSDHHDSSQHIRSNRASAIASFITHSIRGYEAVCLGVSEQLYKKESLALRKRYEKDLYRIWINHIESYIKNPSIYTGEYLVSSNMPDLDHKGVVASSAFKQFYDFFHNHFIKQFNTYSQTIERLVDAGGYTVTKEYRSTVSRDNNNQISLSLFDRLLVKDAMFSFFLATSPYRIWELLHDKQLVSPLRISHAILQLDFKKKLFSYACTKEWTFTKTLPYQRRNYSQRSQYSPQLERFSSLRLEGKSSEDGDAKKVTTTQFMILSSLGKGDEMQTLESGTSRPISVPSYKLPGLIRKAYGVPPLNVDSKDPQPDILYVKVSPNRSHLFVTERGPSVFQAQGIKPLEQALGQKVLPIEITFDSF